MCRVLFLNGLLLRDLLALLMAARDPQCARQAPSATSISQAGDHQVGCVFSLVFVQTRGSQTSACNRVTWKSWQNTDCWALPSVSDSVGPRKDLRICVSNKRKVMLKPPIWGPSSE